MKGFKDNGSWQTREYYYHENGNMLADENSQIESVEYNYLNLPHHIVKSSTEGKTIDYYYSASGIKLREVVSQGNTIIRKMDYIGNFVYNDDHLEFISTFDGRMVPESINEFEYEYALKDHLGNTRIMFSENGDVLQDISYYAFGMSMDGLSYVSSSNNLENRYLYNGKELQDDFDLNWYDYGFRMYDATIGRWHVPDPLTIMFPDVSPYQYVHNNPINRIYCNFIDENMKYKIIFIIFIFFSCSYSHEDIVETTFYPDTDIVRSKKIFKSNEDNELGTYKMIEFDSLGNKLYSFHFKDSILNGKFTQYYPSGLIDYSTNYNQGWENGIARYYNEDGFLITEALIIYDYTIVVKKFTIFHKSKTKGYSVFLVKNDTVIDTEGEIMYDSLMNNIIDSSTYYYNVQKLEKSRDDDIRLNISLLGTSYNEYRTNINLILGELNSENFTNNRYSLLDTIGIIKSAKNELELKCNQFNFENDLVTGLLQLELYSLDGKEKIRDKYFTFYYDLKSD